MKDDVYLSLSSENRDFWNFKFKDRVKLPVANLDAVLFLIGSFALCTLSAVVFLQQELFNFEYVRAYVNFLIPISVFMLFVFCVDLLVRVGLTFHWRGKEKSWLLSVEEFVDEE